MWIVPAAATGAWAGHGGEIAIAEIGGWRFAAPRPGMIAWIADLGVHARYDGGWTADAWPVRALAVGARRLFASDPVAVAAPSGGAVIDAEARGALAALLAALRGQGVIG
jgi:hypothetical protein